MPRVHFLATADNDLLDIFDYVAESSKSAAIARRLTAEIKAKCFNLASLPGTFGRARPELRADIRSVPFKNYVIFFRYVGDRLEVVNILHGHRDIDTFFDQPES